MANGAITLSCPYSATSMNGPVVPYNVSVTAILVVTGTITSGATTLTSAPSMSLTYTTSDQVGSWGQGALYSGAASGVVVQETCTVDQSNVTVQLPPHQYGQLVDGGGNGWDETLRDVVYMFVEHQSAHDADRQYQPILYG